MLTTFLFGGGTAAIAMAPVASLLIYMQEHVFSPVQGVFVAVAIAWAVIVIPLIQRNPWGTLASERRVCEYPHPFVVRPCQESEDLAIEFCCDHHSDNFPDIVAFLQAHYGISIQRPSEGIKMYAMATDHVLTLAACSKGTVVINDDIWGLAITAKGQSQEIIEDIETLLLASGDFRKSDTLPGDSG